MAANKQQPQEKASPKQDLKGNKQNVVSPNPDSMNKDADKERSSKSGSDKSTNDRGNSGHSGRR